MRVLQVTNIISHHQLPLAREVANCIGTKNFRFAATKPPSPERQKLGWKCQEDESWILSAGERAEDRQEFIRWWNEADVVLCGERLFAQIGERLARGKLSFHMTERWWKPPIGRARLLHPRFALMAARFYRLAQNPNFHFLAIGPYAAKDIHTIASFPARIWKWGYFTELPNPLPGCARKGSIFQVLWAGRILNWKRVDTLLRGFLMLLEKRPEATLTLIGDGPERRKIERLSASLFPAGNLRIMPPIPAEEVGAIMRQNQVYVLPSNAYEGWGAVVNEAMAEGCLVIASEAAGAPAAMIKHGENGLLFSPGDWRRLGEMLRASAENEKWRMKIALQGQQTITELWSPSVAAHRFVDLCDALLSGGDAPFFTDGPLAPVRG